MRSMVRKPRLCGVNWYSMPGFPDRQPVSLFLLALRLLAGLRRRRSFLGLLLAFLDDFRLGGSGSHFGASFSRRLRDRFFHGSDVRNRLVWVRNELHFTVVRQIGDAQHLSKDEMADLDA